MALSTMANNGQASAVFSALENPQRIPASTPPVFRGLQSGIHLPLLRLVTNGYVGQAPKDGSRRGQEPLQAYALHARASMVVMRGGV